MPEVMDREYAIHYVTPEIEPENAVPILFRVYMPVNHPASSL